MADILMPQLGETVTEGTVTRWLKAVGDPVAEDEVLFEVSTDKVDSEVPSPMAGVLAQILVAEGDTVDVGTRLAVISDGASSPEPDAAEPDATEPVATEPGATEPAATEAPAPESPAVPPATPAPESPAVPPATLAPESPAVPPADRRPPGSAGGGGGRVLSPVVRRLIVEHDLDPATIEGSGAGGRITRSDVLGLIDRRSNGNAPVPPAASVPPAAPAAPAAPVVEPFAPARATERDTVVPFTNIRRRTAEHMIRSKHTSAHTMVAVEVDYSAVERARFAVKAAFKEAEGFGLTYLPFVSRAVVDAIGGFPHVNASVGDDALVVHHDLNLGIAVDLDFEGLLVPVIHGADGKRLRALAREISNLAGRARSRKLTMDDISGGTLTITNAGPFGTLITVPVINQPQVAIISTDGVRKRPVVVEAADGTDAIAVHPVGNLVMSWDHRAFDGAYAAAFLAEVRTVLETRDWSSEL